jgi:ParB/RepB/Spo0J family partition protein
MILDLKLTQLEADPRNPNVCLPEILEKLKTNIQRTQLCPPLIVRPHPSKKNKYMLIDGHHRKLVLEALGWSTVTCQVWDVSEQEAQLALATLNRLRGTDIPQKRAELLASLTETLSPQALAELIPETEAQIQDLLRFLQLDTDALEKALKAEMAKEAESLPVAYTFLIPAQEKQKVDEALQLFSTTDRGVALVQMCQQVLLVNVDV